jgi:heme/copper-type cytochrome/quinol oxidase subunit 2
MLIFNDIPIRYSIYQNSTNSTLLDRIVLNDILVYWSLILLILIFLILIEIYLNDLFQLFYLTHYENLYLELIYSLLPCILLVILVIPWLHVLLIYHSIKSVSGLTLKVIGYQWYWYNSLILVLFHNHSYVLKKIYIISYTKQSDIFLYRLLEVDNVLLLPVHTNIKLLVTSNDVIHSYSIPSAGVKIDCIPGRINNSFLILSRNTLLNGSCLEGCGSYHYNMNFLLISTNFYTFIWWFYYIYYN